MPQKAETKQGKIRREKPVRWKTVVLCTAVLVLLVSVPLALFSRTGWHQENGVYSYYKWPGTKVKDYWLRENDRYYFFDQDGNMLTGWLNYNGLKYYFGEDGVMCTGWRQIDGDSYYFGEDGVMCTGLRKIEGRYYVLGGDGKLAH